MDYYNNHYFEDFMVPRLDMCGAESTLLKTHFFTVRKIAFSKSFGINS